MANGLEDRMKSQYEDRTRFMLPRRTYTIIRCDGRAFHTYTAGMERPYSLPLMDAMAAAACALCKEAAGAEFGFVQSDEISVLLTDFAKPDTSAWFDGNLQKLCSVSSAIVTAAFQQRARDLMMKPGGEFDARVFTIPDPVEVENYFIWRQKDAERNSVAMLAQSYCSPKQLHGKAIPDQHDLIHAAGDNWNNHPAKYKRGTGIVYTPFDVTRDWTEQPERGWHPQDVPIFTAQREWLTAKVPRQWATDLAIPDALDALTRAKGMRDQRRGGSLTRRRCDGRF